MSIINDTRKSAQNEATVISGTIKPPYETPGIVRAPILKLETKSVTKNITEILIIQRKAPNVSKLMGISKAFKTGFISKLNRERKKAAQKRLIIFSP